MAYLSGDLEISQKLRIVFKKVYNANLFVSKDTSNGTGFDLPRSR